MRWFFILSISSRLFCLSPEEILSPSSEEILNLKNQIYLGSRESDPSSLVENVSTIYGDYTEVEVDLTVTSPDSLILCRFYSSRDSYETANFGGWLFNPHYSGHALDQMQNRGFTPMAVEETLQNGTGVPNKVAGRMQFYDSVNNISVITEDGKIVTVIHGRVN